MLAFHGGSGDIGFIAMGAILATLGGVAGAEADLVREDLKVLAMYAPSLCLDPGTSSADAWTEEAGIRFAGTTSTSTILASSGYRTFLPFLFSGPHIGTSLSHDGLTWSSTLPTGVYDATNPAVIELPALRSRGKGYSPGVGPSMGSSGPSTLIMIYEVESSTTGHKDFYRATSHGGAAFTPSGTTPVLESLASEHWFVSVPDLIRVDSQKIRMYFVGGDNLIKSATSTDYGKSWDREGPIIIDGMADRIAVDPDIIKLDNGTYRLFFAATRCGATGPVGESKSIYSATSTDGRTFAMEYGKRVAADTSLSEDLKDPDVVPIGDGGYRMYFGRGTAGTTGTTSVYSATSP